MTDPISIGLSGLLAASARLNAVASNIANAGDEGPLAPQADGPHAYQPIDVIQNSVPGGGTVATYKPADPATEPAYDPSSPYANDQGLVAMPAVNLTTQVTEALQARQSYKGNLKTIEVAQSMQQALLDTIA